MGLRTILKSYQKNPLKVWRRLISEDRERRRTVPKAVYADFQERVATNGRFRIHQGETLYILCTGPSIREVAVEPLLGKTLISVSHFAQHPECARLRPRYHMLAANHPPFGSEHYPRYIDGLARWDWPFTCLFGYAQYEHSILRHIAKHGVPKFDHSFYRIEPVHFRTPIAYHLERVWDFTRSIPASNTVLVQAIQFAVFAGAARIVLIGCDHDYLHHFGSGEIPHFYAPDRGHDDTEHLKGINTERWFQILANRWETYRRMHEYCRGHGVEIFNATPGSKLDVFPMLDPRAVR